jgi:hypothetical protein
MPDELRYCFTRCCHFVNNQPTSQLEYEKAVERNKPGFGLPGPSESLITCRKSTGFPEAVEKSVGFYLGTGMLRAYGTMMPEGKLPSVFEKATGRFLRQATLEDIKKWQDAWGKEIQKNQPDPPAS